MILLIGQAICDKGRGGGGEEVAYTFKAVLLQCASLLIGRIMRILSSYRGVLLLKGEETGDGRMVDQSCIVG